jgi:uncharacterized protein
MMEICVIPLPEAGEERFLVYRPLTGAAFVANRSMAQLALQGGEFPEGANPQAVKFLQDAGFSQPDPPLPVEPLDFSANSAVLLLTNQCQLRCTYCYAAAGEQPRQELSLEVGQAAIDFVCRQAEAQGLPSFEVSFHGGGEPTAAWSVLRRCTEYAQRKPVPARISLTSNALWSAAQCEWVIDHVNNLTVSMDGQPATQNLQRPRSSGRASAPGVLRSLAALDARAFSYGIRVTALPPWTTLAEDVRFICQSTQCRTIQVEPAFNSARGEHQVITDPDAGLDESFTAAFLDALDVADEYHARLHYSGARPGTRSAIFCAAPYQSLIVAPEGKVVACYEITNQTHPLAAVSTLGEVQNGQVVLYPGARERLHRQMAERRSACRDCFCYWSCAGDCYSRTWLPGANGHQIRGLRCEINRALTRQMILRNLSGHV